jgi:S-adenosylmethionine:tRNA ribosyltransferase-isomerase
VSPENPGKWSAYPKWGKPKIGVFPGLRNKILPRAGLFRTLEEVRVSAFHFDLPDDLIAQHPPAQRGSSRMLVLDRESGALSDEMFASLPTLLKPGDLLILNDSRVLPGRLFATRAGLTAQAGSPQPTGVIEVLLTEQVESSLGENLWQTLVKPARKVQPGETLHFRDAGGETVLTAEVVATGDFGERTLHFAPVPDFYECIGRIGHMPLPPYIRRDQAAQPDPAEDRERYQTVYSHQPGSAAAPTAGLHFTPEILAQLHAQGVEVRYLTLHVGLGTFQPVRVSELKDIRLHSERYTLPAATAEALNHALAEGRRIVAVGTTTTRTLEHIATQAEASTQSQIEPHSGSTSIFLSPGHRFRIVSGLLTNFHLPESTLVMLVSAFAAPAADPGQGRKTVLAAYAHAIRQRYRFYSYGDCTLLL